MHEADNIEIQVQEVVRAIKRRAADNPNAPPTSIFRAEVSTIANQEVLANLPQRNDIVRNINRLQNRHRPANPLTLQDLIVQPPYTTTKNGQQFFQFDSGPEDEDRYTFPLTYLT